MSKKTLLAPLIIATYLLISLGQYTHAADDDAQLAETSRTQKPQIAERAGIRASLDALQRNGSLQQATIESTTRQSTAARRSTQASTEELEPLIPIKHVLTCETESNCQAAITWGNSNNFDTSGILTSDGHGGEVMYHLYLRQNIPPLEDTLVTQSNRVHEGIQNLAGIRYATWVLDLDPTGENDNGTDQ